MHNNFNKHHTEMHQTSKKFNALLYLYVDYSEQRKPCICRMYFMLLQFAVPKSLYWDFRQI